jgi:hypothetical protein
MVGGYSAAQQEPSAYHRIQFYGIEHPIED